MRRDIPWGNVLCAAVSLVVTILCVTMQLSPVIVAVNLFAAILNIAVVIASQLDDEAE